MLLFKKKQFLDAIAKEQDNEKKMNVELDSSILKENDITRLSIDERWLKLFVAIKMPPELEKAEQEMNELIKEEAMLKNEQDNLEPQKRKLMNEILSLTKEAYENDSDQAKKRLKECKREIEHINSRIDNVVKEIEILDDKLKKANLDLLNTSINYIFSTLKSKNESALKIKKELKEIEQRQKALKARLETIAVDWTQYAVDLTNLIGAGLVREFEDAYKLEGLKDEAVDTSTDESN